MTNDLYCCNRGQITGCHTRSVRNYRNGPSVAASQECASVMRLAFRLSCTCRSSVKIKIGRSVVWTRHDSIYDPTLHLTHPTDVPRTDYRTKTR
jgi:hypothetical protein